MSSLYIFDNYQLSDRWFFKYFLSFSRPIFNSVECFFCYTENFLVWCSPACCFLLLLLVLWMSYPKKKKSLPRPMLRSFFHMFSSRSFIVSSLTFKFINPLWVSFCECYSPGVQFHSFECEHPVFEEYFPPLDILDSLIKYYLTIYA